MDTVTYPHAVVKRELDQYWLDARLDVTSAANVAALFGVSAIPTAIAVTEHGIVRGRVQGSAEPEAFRQQLEALRAKR